MGNFLVRHASRVVIYDRRAVIRLATGLENVPLLVVWHVLYFQTSLTDGHRPWFKCKR